MYICILYVYIVYSSSDKRTSTASTRTSRRPDNGNVAQHLCIVSSRPTALTHTAILNSRARETTRREVVHSREAFAEADSWTSDDGFGSPRLPSPFARAARRDPPTLPMDGLLKLSVMFTLPTVVKTGRFLAGDRCSMTVGR